MIEHDYFGAIATEEDPLWSESIVVGDQDVRIELRDIDDRDILIDDLDVAASMVGRLDEYDEIARGYIVQAMADTGGDVMIFVSEAIEQMGTELDAYLPLRTGELEIDLIKSLVLEQMTIYPAQDDGEQFAIYTYVLNSDQNDQDLHVGLTRTGELFAIEIVE